MVCGILSDYLSALDSPMDRPRIGRCRIEDGIHARAIGGGSAAAGRSISFRTNLGGRARSVLCSVGQHLSRCTSVSDISSRATCHDIVGGTLLERTAVLL